MSAFTNYNIEKPFLHLCRLLLADPNLEFMATQAMEVPEVMVVPEHVRFIDEKIKNLEKELQLLKQVRVNLM